MKSPKILKKAFTDDLSYDNKSTSFYQNRIINKVTAENVVNPTDGDRHDLKYALTIDGLLDIPSPTITNQQTDSKQISTQLAVKSLDKLTGLFRKKSSNAGVQRTISLQLHKTIEKTIDNRMYKPINELLQPIFCVDDNIPALLPNLAQFQGAVYIKRHCRLRSSFTRRLFPEHMVKAFHPGNKVLGSN